VLLKFINELKLYIVIIRFICFIINYQQSSTGEVLTVTSGRKTSQAGIMVSSILFYYFEYNILYKINIWITGI